MIIGTRANLRRIMLALSALFVLLALTVLPKPAFSQSRSPIKMKVSIGYAGRFVHDWPVPVEIELESSRAISGTINASSDPQSGEFFSKSMNFELPAGGKKIYRMTIDLVLVYEVTITSDGKRVGRERVTLLPEDGMLVGILESPLPSGITTNQRDVTQESVKAVPVSRDQLDLGFLPLKHLSYIVVDADASRQISPRRAEVLRDWVLEGGRLIVGTANPAAVSWVPEPWKGTEALPAVAGLGEVIVTEPLNSFSADVGRWTALIRPYAFNEPGSLGAPIDDVDLQLAASITGSPFGSSRISWIGFFVLFYLIVVGPGLYLVLRLVRRKELMWVAIPASAVLFSVVGFVTARAGRGEDVLRQASTFFSTAQESSGNQLVVAGSRSAKTIAIGFEGFDARVPRFSEEYYAIGRGPVVVGPKGEQALLDLDPFEMGVVSGRSKAEAGHIDAKLIWDGMSFSGSVTNKTGYELKEVRMIFGGREFGVGQLSRDATIPITADPRPPQDTINLRAYNITADDLSPEFVRSAQQYAIAGAAYAHLGMDFNVGPPIVFGLADGYQNKVVLDREKLSVGGLALFSSPVNVEFPQAGRGHLLPSMGYTSVLHSRGTIATFYGFSGYSSGVQQSGLVVSGPDTRLLWKVPPSLRGRRFTSTTLAVGLDHSSIMGGRLQPAPPPGQLTVQQPVAQGDVRAEVFDWKHSRWIGFSLPTGFSSNPVPDTVLNKHGEVLIRVDPGALQSIDIWTLGLEADIT